MVTEFADFSSRQGSDNAVGTSSERSRFTLSTIDTKLFKQSQDSALKSANATIEKHFGTPEFITSDDTETKQPSRPGEGKGQSGSITEPLGLAKGEGEFLSRPGIAKPEVPDKNPKLDLSWPHDDIHEFMSKNKTSVDYGALLTKEKPLLVFGEAHGDDAIQQELIEQAKTFKSLGVTHFALEQIPASMQGTLDKYFKGDKGARDEISKHLELWDRAAKPFDGQKYMEILDAMKEQGIRPVGLDSDDHGLNADEAAHDRRNAKWAGIIAKTMKDNPDSKLVALVGAYHAGAHSTSVTSELAQKHGIQSTVAHVIDGYAPQLRNRFAAKAARSADLNKERFMVPVGSKLDVDKGAESYYRGSADWLIHRSHERSK